MKRAPRGGGREGGFGKGVEDGLAWPAEISNLDVLNALFRSFNCMGRSWRCIQVTAWEALMHSHGIFFSLPLFLGLSTVPWKGTGGKWVSWSALYLGGEQ